MNLKSVSALILGLLIQIMPMFPAMGASVERAVTTPRCACCDGLDSCPCAGRNESAPVPQPLTPAGDSVGKYQPMAQQDVSNRIVPIQLRALHVLTGAPRPDGVPVGFHGVRYSVAFCSFVI